MLKLVRSRNREISIRLKNKAVFFNKPFLIALSAALSLHLLALLLFHIHPFFISSDRILPPIMVEADLSELLMDGDQGTLAQVKKDEVPGRHALTPPKSHPEIPLMPMLLSDRHHVIQQPLKQSNPFLSLEENWDFLSQKPIPKKTPLNIAVSGLLAERPLTETVIQPPPSLERDYRLVYHVEVENKTGCICWYAPVLAAENSVYRKWTEEALKRIRFAPSEEGFMTAGEIEFSFAGAS
ncbi:MAG: hypothetical protein H0X51_07320 [Parachlamydiaceae bacterium]|nr:hypothetical protein [Parachlamydiaceae bacterium]